MALIYVDGWDHYTTISDKMVGSGGTASITSAASRFGAGGLRLTSSNYYAYEAIPGTPGSTYIVGFAYRGPTVGVPGSSNITPIRIRRSNSDQFCLQFDGSGRLLVKRGGETGTQLGSGTAVFKAGIWYYIEIKFTLNTSTGTVVVRVNGVTDVNLSGVNNCGQGSTTADQIMFCGVGSGFVSGNFDYDDHYICDSSGSTNNDFLGDVKVETLMPNGAGSATAFTRGGTDSGANWSQVDEAAPNADTDYVVSGTPGDRDLYAMGDLATTAGTIYGVQIGIMARKDDAGTRSVHSVLKTGASTVTGTDLSLGASYLYQFNVFETKPGGGAWTVADVNSTELGFEIVS